MLKIKDNVDLKELKKYGFIPIYDEYTGKQKYFIMGTDSPYSFKISKLDFHTDLELKTILRRLFYIRKDLRNAWIIQVTNFSNFTDVAVDVIYDMIKDGLVEKVEE